MAHQSHSETKKPVMRRPYIRHTAGENARAWQILRDTPELFGEDVAETLYDPDCDPEVIREQISEVREQYPRFHKGNE
ncbi:MAG: hypothetical protein AAB421_01230 [Patescibacteria group bacterium]